jgi:hypothetical protein
MAKKPNRKPDKELSFSQLQRMYGLQKPRQIKMRIIWNHVQAIMINLYGDSPENLRKLRRYDLHFTVAENADQPGKK